MILDIELGLETRGSANLVSKKWVTKGAIPGRTTLPYGGDEQTPEKVVFQGPEQEPIRRKAEDILRWISVSLPFGRLLDVGCGPAHLTYWAEKLAPQFTIYSFDQSRRFLMQARDRIANPQLIEGDLAEGLPVRDGAFEGVLYSDVLEHVPPDKVLNAVVDAHRIIRSGGWIFINIPNRHTWTEANKKNSRHLWLASKQEMIDLLTVAGFDTRRVQITTRGFPGSNLVHKIANHDFYLPYLGRSIFIKAPK